MVIHPENVQHRRWFSILDLFLKTWTGPQRGQDTLLWWVVNMEAGSGIIQYGGRSRMSPLMMSLPGFTFTTHHMSVSCSFITTCMGLEKYAVAKTKTFWTLKCRRLIAVKWDVDYCRRFDHNPLLTLCYRIVNWILRTIQCSFNRYTAKHRNIKELGSHGKSQVSVFTFWNVICCYIIWRGWKLCTVLKSVLVNSVENIGSRPLITFHDQLHIIGHLKLQIEKQFE